MVKNKIKQVSLVLPGNLKVRKPKLCFFLLSKQTQITSLEAPVRLVCYEI